MKIDGGNSSVFASVETIEKTKAGFIEPRDSKKLVGDSKIRIVEIAIKNIFKGR